MFHGIPKDFEKRLVALSKRARFVKLGEPVPLFSNSYLLTFDDAYCDFYFKAYPVLKKHSIPALLAITPTCLTDKACDRSPIERMDAIQAIKPHFTPPPYAFCSWEEILEMQASRLIEMASHGLTHLDMKAPSTHIKEELEVSQQILYSKTGILPKAFVYPYGRWTPEVHKQTGQFYSYGLRIGNAMNFSWKCSKRPLLRVDGEKRVSRLRLWTKTLVERLKNF